MTSYGGPFFGSRCIAENGYFWRNAIQQIRGAANVGTQAKWDFVQHLPAGGLRERITHDYRAPDENGRPGPVVPASAGYGARGNERISSPNQPDLNRLRRCIKNRWYQVQIYFQIYQQQQQQQQQRQQQQAQAVSMGPGQTGQEAVQAQEQPVEANDANQQQAEAGASEGFGYDLPDAARAQRYDAIVPFIEEIWRILMEDIELSKEEQTYLVGQIVNIILDIKDITINCDSVMTRSHANVSQPSLTISIILHFFCNCLRKEHVTARSQHWTRIRWERGTI